MSFLRQLLGYGLASAAALCVDAGLLYYLVKYCAFGVLAASTLSFSAGAAVAYLLAVRVAFSEHRTSNRRVEFAIFFLLGVAGLMVNASVMVLGTWLGLQLIATKACAAVATFACNFVLRRQVLFVSPEQPHGVNHVLVK